MPIYNYKCQRCHIEFEEALGVDDRYDPVSKPCPTCGVSEVIIKVPSHVNFWVKEGALGNAANGYSEYHGDAENFKARAKNKPIPYPKPKRGKG